MMQTDTFLNWAKIALTHYNLPQPTVKFIGHSENLTFQIEDHMDSRKFLLRLHMPITENFAGVRQQPLAIKSELCWLEALKKETDITVQQPVRNIGGELVTSIASETDIDGLSCSLLGWIEGDVLQPDAPNAVKQTGQMGYLVAKLHTHAVSWQPPAAFMRPVYDTESFRQVGVLLNSGVPGGVISQADYQFIQEAIRCLIDEIDCLARTPEYWGLIHNDLHPNNCLIRGHEICPIDFSLCGFGYFLSDLGTCLGSLSLHLRRAFLTGYLQGCSLPTNHIRLIEAFFIMSRLTYYAFVLPNRSHRAWLQGRIPQFVAEICQRFLRDETFLFIIR